VVKKNFGLVIMAIIVVSVVPIAIETIKAFLEKRKLSGSAG
jgi:hypothetical protein